MQGRNTTKYGMTDIDAPSLKQLNESKPEEEQSGATVGELITNAFLYPINILASAASTLAGTPKHNDPVSPSNNNELVKLKLCDIGERNLHPVICPLIAILINEGQIKQKHSKTEQDRFISLLDGLLTEHNIKEFNKLSQDTKNDILLLINEALVTFSQKTRLTWYKNKIAEYVLNIEQKPENGQRSYQSM